MEKKERPAYGKFLGFDHITFWVGNAKQAASYYVTQFGFQYLAYSGLETGNSHICSHVVKNHEGSTFVFCSAYTKTASPEMNQHLINHGDGAKDVAFTVQNTRAVYEYAVTNGAQSVAIPKETSDENGSVVTATIKTYGDTTHTFVERTNYKGLFLPSYHPHPLKGKINSHLPTVRFEKIDHVVGNQAETRLEPVVNFYQKCLDFHRFWSVDEKMMHSSYSALRSIVVTDYDEMIKMPINEPFKSKKKSQIQEYLDYYDGAGVQHIALKTETIIQTVENMRERGVDFLSIPDTYYDILRKNLPDMTIKVAEDLEYLQKNKILIDYDEKGYLLQIFTKPVQDKPTLFFEVIQRRNHQGFGVGNFKSLFLSVEEEQRKRGNLTDY